jgi:hypothetical protein
MPSISFHSLPKELRLLIWEFVCELPRVVEVIIDTGRLTTWPVEQPNLLSVNHESRQVALKLYTLMFGHPNQISRVPEFWLGRGVPPKVYFNLSADILKITDQTLRLGDRGFSWPVLDTTFRYLSESDLRQIKRLAVPASLDDNLRDILNDDISGDLRWSGYVDGLRHLHSLEEIFLIIDKSGDKSLKLPVPKRCRLSPYKKLSGSVRDGISKLEIDYACRITQTFLVKVEEETRGLPSRREDAASSASVLRVKTVWEEPFYSEDSGTAETSKGLFRGFLGIFKGW